MDRFLVSAVLFCAAIKLVSVASAQDADASTPFTYRHALAPRDSYGRLHQMPQVDATDFAPRYSTRFHYYFMGQSTLTRDAAYMAAVQNALRRLGYYCGPTDGLFTPEVSDAIARLQKNCLLRVTGTLNVGVRRELHLP